jgi:sugar phosphate isomerase/epimerase
MKLGSTSWVLVPAPGTDPILGRIDRAVELGLSVISVGFRDPAQRTPEYMQKVAEYAAKKGIELRLGGGGRIGSADPEERKAEVERVINDLLEVNKHTGIRFSSFANGPMPHNRWTTDPPMGERIDIIGENLAIIGDAIRQAGMTLGLENHCDYRGWECAAMLAKANRPNVMAQLDTGNPFTVFEEPVDCAKAMAKYVVSCHLKDIKVTPLVGNPWYGTRAENAILGQGHVDNVAICKILQEQAPDPASLALMVEPLTLKPEDDPNQYLMGSLTWAREKLARFLS